MKTKILLLSLAVAGVLTGCKDSFLDRVPESSYVDATYYTSDEALEMATAPLYNRAWFDYNSRACVPLGCNRANDIFSNWGYPEFTTFRVTALDGNLSNAWKAFYSVITMSNSVIEAVETKASGSVSQEAKETAIAEARLMRACAYFYMLRIWGPVIIVEDNQALADNPVLPLNREEDVFQFIINDLTYASEHLPTTAAAGRATAWAAKGMLAKVYLARSGWKKGGQRDAADLELAKQYAGDVCENSGIELLPEYEDLFKYKQNNNQESLLAMQWVPLGDWGVCNTLLADLAFSTEVTGGVNVWSSYNASIEMLQQYELGDTIRRNATFFTKGSYYDYICIADGGYTYTGNAAPIKKGVIGGPDDDNDGYVQSMNSPLNTYILRLADVYLKLHRPAKADSLLPSCVAFFEREQAGMFLPYLRTLQMDLALQQGDRAQVERLIRDYPLPEGAKPEHVLPRLEQLLQTFGRQILSLHGNQHIVGCCQCVDSQHSQTGHTVQQNEVILTLHRFNQLFQNGFSAHGIHQRNFHAGQRNICRNQIHPFHVVKDTLTGRKGCFLHDLCHQLRQCGVQIIRSGITQADGQAPLGVYIHQKDFFALLCQANTQIFTGCGFSCTALLVDYRQNSRFVCHLHSSSSLNLTGCHVMLNQ